MRTVFRSVVEFPLDMYKKVVLLVVAGEFNNIKEVVIKGVEELVKKYDDKFFAELAEKHKPLLEKIDNAKSVVVRGRIRKWKIS